MIKYNPKDAVAVLQPGEYPAVLMACEEKTSKSSGSPMYELAFQVYNGSGSIMVFDYVVIPTFLWKLKRLARAFGVEPEFEAGTFDPTRYLERNLRLKLSIRKQEGYDDKNQIDGYLAKGLADQIPAASDDSDAPVDLPF